MIKSRGTGVTPRLVQTSALPLRKPRGPRKVAVRSAGVTFLIPRRASRWHLPNGALVRINKTTPVNKSCRQSEYTLFLGWASLPSVCAGGNRSPAVCVGGRWTWPLWVRCRRTISGY